MEAISEEVIYKDICYIMTEYGPDGHTDGSDKITKYILSRLAKQETIIEQRERNITSKIIGVMGAIIIFMLSLIWK